MLIYNISIVIGLLCFVLVPLSDTTVSGTAAVELV
jgi:hypothetical protein